MLFITTTKDERLVVNVEVQHLKGRQDYELESGDCYFMRPILEDARRGGMGMHVGN